jgi:hypothetical protein
MYLPLNSKHLDQITATIMRTNEEYSSQRWEPGNRSRSIGLVTATADREISKEGDAIRKALWASIRGSRGERESSKGSSGVVRLSD